MKYGLISAILHYFQRKSQAFAVVSDRPTNTTTLSDRYPDARAGCWVASPHTYAYLRLRSDIVTQVETPADLILSSQTDTSDADLYCKVRPKSVRPDPPPPPLLFVYDMLFLVKSTNTVWTALFPVSSLQMLMSGLNRTFGASAG